MKLAERIGRIAPSGTLAVIQKAQEMKRRGIDVISFGAGEPDFDTPELIRNAAKSALDGGYTRYTPAQGLPEIRDAITEFVRTNRGISYNTDQVIVTCGAKAAIFIALQVLVNPGDEVIIPAPYWVSYPDQVKLADGMPVIIGASEENSLKITPAELERAITGKTRVLIINTPSNPSGTVYSKGELNKLVEICLSHGITIIADEIYDRLVYDGEYCSVINSHPDAVKNTIYVNGVSKTYAMTGWRMGFAAGPKDVIAAMIKYQGQCYTSITSFVQKASVSALKSPPEIVDGMVARFRERRDIMAGLINEVPGIHCIKPPGAFYFFVNVEKILAKKLDGAPIGSSARLAEHLLEKAHVATVPGSAFGMEGYIRFSFATSEENIKEGMKRIKEAVEKLS